MASVTEPHLPLDQENGVPGYEYSNLLPESKAMKDIKRIKRYQNMQNSYEKQKVLMVPQG